MAKTTTTPMGSPTPRQRVAALIDDLITQGSQGENILQHIEQQVVGFSGKHRRLGFFWAKFTDDEMDEAA